MYTGESFLVRIIDRTFKNRKDFLIEVKGTCLSPDGQVEGGLKELMREVVQGHGPKAPPQITEHLIVTGSQLFPCLLFALGDFSIGCILGSEPEMVQSGGRPALWVRRGWRGYIYKPHLGTYCRSFALKAFSATTGYVVAAPKVSPCPSGDGLHNSLVR